MRARPAVWWLAATALLAGCSAHDWQRTGYQTLQNLHERECRQQLDAGCPRRQHYDSYQRQRPV